MITLISHLIFTFIYAPWVRRCLPRENSWHAYSFYLYSYKHDDFITINANGDQVAGTRRSPSAGIIGSSTRKWVFDTIYVLNEVRLSWREENTMYTLRELLNTEKLGYAFSCLHFNCYNVNPLRTAGCTNASLMLRDEYL